MRRYDVDWRRGCRDEERAERTRKLCTRRAREKKERRKKARVGCCCETREAKKEQRFEARERGRGNGSRQTLATPTLGCEIISLVG
jgi:hypothetical protein